MQVRMDSIWVRQKYSMVGMESGVSFDAFGTQEFQARTFRAEVGDGFLLVLAAGDVVAEVGFHVLETERLLHF